MMTATSNMKNLALKDTALKQPATPEKRIVMIGQESWKTSILRKFSDKNKI